MINTPTLQTNNKELWDRVLLDLEMSLSKANFNTWFKNTALIKQEDGVATVSVPNQFFKDWLVRKYHKIILSSLRNASEGIRNVEYVVSKDAPKAEAKQKPLIEMATPELPLENLYINSEDNLNPKYTFESFVVGPFNELAHAAAQAVIKNPGGAYNPLFIYGETGLGKTHLIQSIGNYIKTNFPGKRIFYITSEKFTLDVVTGIQNNRINDVKQKYRKYDVLIMDDIQFLTKKERTQEELFHLFNNLYDNNKQIVFSSDKHINYIPNLEDRLRSRFSVGMIVDISPPDHESRVAIIKTKTRNHSLDLADDVLHFLAQGIGGNIREIEGTINLISFQTRLKNKALSLLEIKNLLKETSRPKRAVSIKDVIKTVSDFYDIPETNIYEKSRRKEIVKPRQLIMYILREDFKISYPTIGEKLGGRDHTTVIHSCEKIKNDIKENQTLTQEIQQIRALLQ